MDYEVINGFNISNRPFVKPGTLLRFKGCYCRDYANLKEGADTFAEKYSTEVWIYDGKLDRSLYTTADEILLYEALEDFRRGIFLVLSAQRVKTRNIKPWIPGTSSFDYNQCLDLVLLFESKVVTASIYNFHDSEPFIDDFFTLVNK